MWRLDPGLFQALTASGNLGLLTLDAGLYVVEINPWLADRVQFRPPIDNLKAGSARRAAGIHITTLFPELPQSTFQQLRTCLDTRQSRLLSALMHHPIFPLPGISTDGWMYQTVRLIPLVDSPGLAVLIEDISEQMIYSERLQARVAQRTQALTDAEARHRTLLAVMGEAVIVTDLAGYVTEWAAASPDTYGWRADEVIGRRLSDFMHTRYEDPTENSRSIYAVLMEGGRWRGNMIQRRKDGSLINIASTVTLLRDPDEKPVGMVALNHDITESKELGATLSRLEQINRAISSRLNLNDIFNTLAAQLQSMLPVDHINLSLLEPDKRSFVLQFVFNQSQTHLQIGKPQPLNGSLLAIVAQTQQPLIIPDIEKRQCPAKALAQMEGARSVMLLPLISGQEVLGAISFISYQLNTFTRLHADLLANTADQIAIAITTARLFENNKRMQASLQDLSRRLLRAQEAERAHIARELHDHIGQNLTVLKLNLQQAAADLRTAPAGKTVKSAALLIDESRDISDQLLQLVRNLSLDMRPALLDDLGLAAALRWHLERTARSAGLTIHISTSDDIGRYSDEIETVFFRVAQEAFTNVQRHAHARNLWLQLTPRRGRLELHITDDGAGFDLRGIQPDTGKGLGLKSMAERAELIGAEFEIDSTLGQGTRVSLVCTCEMLE